MHETSEVSPTYTSPTTMCESVQMEDIDYLAASDPQEAATRSLRFCEVTHENACDMNEIAVTEAERERLALLDSNAKCGYELLEITLYSIALILIFAVLITNLILALVIIRYQTLRTSTNKLILSLAISDMVFALSSIYSEVMNILQSAAEMNYNYERLEQIITIRSIEELCLLLDGPGLIYASMMASVLTLTCIASEKYIAIFHPFKYYRIVTNRNIWISAVAIWVFSILFGLTPLVWNTFDGTCTMTDKTAYGYMLLWTCICLACALLMLTLYTRIFLVAHRQARAIHARQCMFLDNNDKTAVANGDGHGNAHSNGKRGAQTKWKSTSRSLGKRKMVANMFLSGKYTSKHEVEFPSAYTEEDKKLKVPDRDVKDNTLDVYTLANKNGQDYEPSIKSKTSRFDFMDNEMLNDKINDPVTLNVTLNGSSNPITITVSDSEPVVPSSPVPGILFCTRDKKNGNLHCSRTNNESNNIQLTKLDTSDVKMPNFTICDMKPVDHAQMNETNYGCKPNDSVVKNKIKQNGISLKPKHKISDSSSIHSTHPKSELNCCFTKRNNSIESQILPLITKSSHNTTEEAISPSPDTMDKLQNNNFSQPKLSSKDIVLQTVHERPNSKLPPDHTNGDIQQNIRSKKLSVIPETSDDVKRKLSLLSPLNNIPAKPTNPLKPLRRISTAPLLDTTGLHETDTRQSNSTPGRKAVAPLRRMATVTSLFPVTPKGGTPASTQRRSPSTKSLPFSHKLFPPSFRAVKTIAIILGAFYVCWLPLLIYILAFKDRYSNFTIQVLALLALINSLLNPLIYGFKNKGIRVAMKRMVWCGEGGRRRGSETVHSVPYDTAYNGNH